MSDAAIAKPGHNLPPIVPPTDADMLADLQARYPELVKEADEFEKALATYPDELALKDEVIAQALQDLLGKMKKHKTLLGAHKKSEKAPWDKLVKVVQNFFTKHDEKIDGWLEIWLPRHQAYLDLKKAEAVRKAEEEAEKQRAAEEASRKAAEEAERRAAAAREEEAAARRREEEARARAEEEERKAAEAREAAERAAAEERRIADERKARERAERETNDTNLRAIRRHMKDVEKLNTLADADEATEAEIAQLDAFIRPGGVVGALAGPVANSHLLDDEERAEIEAVRARLDALRKAVNARFDAKERRRREAERKKAEKAEAEAAETRRIAREAEEAKAEEARKARKAAEDEAIAAKERQKAAQGDVREARADQRGAVSDQKGAAKEVKQATTDADRAANRADRIENRLEGSDAEIAGPLRGDLGTKGSLTRRWAHRIVDEAALRAACGPLGEHFTEEALSGAAYRWMMAHITGFKGERVEDALPGVVFSYEQGARIA